MAIRVLSLEEKEASSEVERVVGGMLGLPRTWPAPTLATTFGYSWLGFLAPRKCVICNNVRYDNVHLKSCNKGRATTIPSA